MQQPLWVQAVSQQEGWGQKFLPRRPLIHHSVLPMYRDPDVYTKKDPDISCNLTAVTDHHFLHGVQMDLIIFQDQINCAIFCNESQRYVIVKAFL